MKQIIESNRCTGCGACASSCKSKAISMKPDSRGFLHPSIDYSRCSNCGLCSKICPPLNYYTNPPINSEKLGYAARIRNIEERKKSSSGGIFMALAHYIISKGGYVVGAAFDADYEVEYKIINDEIDLHYLQGSKYLQCRADSVTFPNIQILLKEGKLVLFIGLACQIEGLLSFLRNDYENLFCIDLICMGVPSAKVWRKYISVLFPEEKPIAVNFKEKSLGWDKFTLAIDTKKSHFREVGAENAYFQSMFKTFNMRRSCFRCSFKKIDRKADITLADCWGVASSVPSLNDNLGLSSVIIHSAKGRLLWEAIIPSIEFIEVPVEAIVKGNPNLISNRKEKPIKSKLFFLLLNYWPHKAFELAKYGAKAFIK